MRSEHYEVWWQALLAVPATRTSRAYRRLKRIWRDNTRIAGRLSTEHGIVKGQELTEPSHETHWTVNAWEIFSVLPDRAWLPAILAESGLDSDTAVLPNATWSYEFESPVGTRGVRQCDVVLRFDLPGGGERAIVFEAKRPQNVLSDKDLDPDYYLTIPRIAATAGPAICYLLDDAGIRDARIRIKSGRHRPGFITWQQLATVQVVTAREIEASPEIQAFVGKTIYDWWCRRGIVPAEPPLRYLMTEPTVANVLSAVTDRQTTGERQRALWALNER